MAALKTKIDPINAALGQRKLLSDVQDEIAAARESLHAEMDATADYVGGLPAEITSAKFRRKKAKLAARLAARKAWVSRKGRPIDLVALLKQSRPDGLPLWALADPMRASDQNVRVDSGGDYVVGNNNACGNYDNKLSSVIKVGRKTGRSMRPADGIPPLPPVARRIVIDKDIRRRAHFVHLLYQPAEWLQVNPDPAIVVEWIDLPGQYFALCVWGADRPQIMEFVS